MKSEAKKRSDNKYDLAHFTVLGCKVKKEYAEEFKSKCKDYGTSPNEIFKKAMQSFLEYPEDWTDNAADPEDQEPENNLALTGEALEKYQLEQIKQQLNTNK